MLCNGFNRMITKVTCFFLCSALFIGYMNNYFIKISWGHYINDSLVLLYFLFTPSASIYLLIIIFVFWYYNFTSIPNCKLPLKIYFILLINYYFDYYTYLHYVLFFIRKNPTNVSLQNGILNIHPLLIYIIYVFVLLLIWILYIRNQHRIFLFEISTNIYKIIVCTAVGILLGSFWASQELNWGGFWSWDPVELLSLIVLFFLLRYFHSIKKYFLIITNSYIYILYIILFYIILRLNFITTIHSFIQSKLQPNHLLYFFVTHLILLLLYVLNSFFKIVKFKNLQKVKTTAKSNITIYKKCLFYLVSVVTGHLILLMSARVINIFSVQIAWIFIFYVLFILLLGIIYTNILFRNISITLLLLLQILSCCNYMLLGEFFFLLSLLIFVLIINQKLRFKVVHYYMLIQYVVFVIFFIGLKTYKYSGLIYPLKFIVNQNGYNLVPMEFYESEFFLKTNLFLLKIKQLLKHVNSFSVYSNNFVSFFFFSKNNRLFNVFSEDTIYAFVYLWATLILLYFYRFSNSFLLFKLY